MAELIELQEIRVPPLILNHVESMTLRQIENYRDDNEWKLHHIAAYWGHLNAVNKLIRLGIDFEEKIEGKIATELAFERGHFEVVLNLLQTNFQYPQNFNTANVSDELKQFVKLSQNLHASIMQENIVNIEQILSQNHNLRHFYNTQNQSARRVALKNRKLISYEVLVAKKLSLGLHEVFDDIVRDYSQEDLQTLREIHLRLSPGALKEPMSILFSNSYFGPDCPNGQEHRNFISEAYNFLFFTVGLTSILNAVAASRTFKIVFDFSRDAVNYLDPTSDSSTDGLCYLSGKIFIGALNILNPARKFEVFGVIAHELTHYAMFLTYNNWTNPYFKNDLTKETEFNEILEDCEENCGEEDIIDKVFFNYHAEKKNAELIVRVPQMMAQYHNQPNILAQRREIFARLFNYYEQNCVPEMVRALPRIKKKFRSEKEKKSARRKRNLWILSLIFGLFMVLGLPISFWFWLHSFSWENLSLDQKATVENTSINYLDCKVKLGSVFLKNSEIYFKLTSSEILGTLLGSPFEFPRNVDEEMEKFVYLNGSNLPECPKDKLLTSNVNFQGQNLTIFELLTNKSRAFELLNSSQIVQILKGEKKFNISKKIDQKSKFYVERELAGEKCLKFKEGKRHKDAFGEWTCCLKCPRSNLSTILVSNNNSRLFLLSSPAGQGKSTTFRHFALKLKEKWPQKWVEFVNLKKHLEAFEIGKKTEFNTSEVIKNFFAKTLLNLTYFESAVFAEKFQNGDVIFLWDGIDEISPFFKKFMLDLTSKYNNLTENWQFVSTRPLFSEEVQEKLNISAFGLAPLDEEKKFEFFVKFSLFDQFKLDVHKFYESIRPSLNFSLPIKQILTDLRKSKAFIALNQSKVEKIIEIIENGDKILKTIENSDENLSPILIEMAVEAAKNENFTISQNFNTFLLYENFVDIKFEIALEKGREVAKDLNQWIQAETLTYSKAHQVFALRRIFYFDVSREYLDEKIEKVLKKKSNVKISRFGILNVNLEKDFDFVHQTFAEFFAAKFFINNLIEDLTLNNDFEITIFLDQVTQVFLTERFQVVRKFITDFYDLNQNKNLDFPKYLREHKLKLEILKKINEGKKIVEFFQTVDFSYYFVAKYKISTRLILAPDFNFDFSHVILQSNWEKLGEIFAKEKMRFVLEIRDRRTYNFLLYFCSLRFMEDTTLLPQMLKLYEENFNQNQLKELLFIRKSNQNVLMLAVQALNVEFFEILWNFIKKNLKAEEIREFLKMKGKYFKRSALELSSLNDNVEMFSFVQKIFNKTLTCDEIKELILTFDEDDFPNSFMAAETENSEVCIEISKFLFEFFEDDILTLKNVFKRRAGETILSFIKIKRKNEKCFEFYKEKWRTFYENQESFEMEFKEMLND